LCADTCGAVSVIFGRILLKNGETAPQVQASRRPGMDLSEAQRLCVEPTIMVIHQTPLGPGLRRGYELANTCGAVSVFYGRIHLKIAQTAPQVLMFKSG
jgi:hypothetical protein